MLIDISPFLTYVRSEFLYYNKEGFGYFSDATPYAISNVSGKFLSFNVMVSDKTIFTHTPICALANDKTAPKLSEDDCNYFTAPDDYANVIQHEYLSSISECGVWKKDSLFWQMGMYLMTVEWSKVNTQLHLIELSDGNYVFWGDNSITWGSDVPEKLPEYVV